MRVLPIHNKRWRFARAVIEFSPEDPGVYALWKGGELAYYGRTSADTTIRACLLEHFSGCRGECTREATHYSWEMSKTPATREAELLNDYWSDFGRFPQCNEAETIERASNRRQRGVGWPRP